MRKRLHPSRQNLQRAVQLGVRMARTARALHPLLGEASQYATYASFRRVHRHQLERQPAFVAWDLQLMALVEAEASAHAKHTEDSRHWDRYYTEVGETLREAFWLAWEQLYRLQQRYTQRVEIVARDRRQDDVAVSTPSLSTVAKTDADLWGSVARKVFDEKGEEVQEDFWELPDADSLASKARQSCTPASANRRLSDVAIHE